MKKIAFSIFLVFISFCINAQVNEPASNEVYNYLYRMAQKGLITWKDYQLPVDRRAILIALAELKKNDSSLSAIESKELDFYLKDFAFDAIAADSMQDEQKVESITILKKDTTGRFRTALIGDNKYKLFVDPLAGISSLLSNGKHNTQYFAGVRFAGYFGKHFGINFSFRDITVKGDTINRLNTFTPEQGIVGTGETSNSINYSSLNFNIAYRWNKGSLSFGKDNLTWGYGISGNIVLSNKAPSYPYIKLDFYPWKWLHFNYFHGWLASDILDSARTYGTGSGVAGSRREVFRSKFIANHSVTVTPVKGLDIALGESMVYSDKINIGYLIPVNFFKAYDHYTSDYNINAGSNAQFFGQISSRNHLKKTHLYAEFFIDEIKISKIFNKTERRNQVGYTLGINRTDVIVNYLSIGAEYSRINPFVYNNLIQTQTYTSHSYSLGDWMGNNADRLYIYLNYTPVPKLKLKTWFENIRKGAAGTIQQQYNQQPQPAFLFEKLFTQQSTGVSATYEWINKLMLFSKVESVQWKYPTTTQKMTSFNFGVSYGL